MTEAARLTRNQLTTCPDSLRYQSAAEARLLTHLSISRAIRRQDLSLAHALMNTAEIGKGPLPIDEGRIGLLDELKFAEASRRAHLRHLCLRK
eukprot:4534860-Pyramimonas_sp.AAC.1